MISFRLSLKHVLLAWLVTEFSFAAITSGRYHRSTGAPSSSLSYVDGDDVSELDSATRSYTAGRSRETITREDADVQADDWRLHTTADGEVVLVTDEHRAEVVLTPASRIQLGTVSFTSTAAIKGEKGETGSIGTVGRRGARGMRGPVGEKGLPGDHITFNGPLHVNFATSMDVCGPTDTGRIRIDEIGESLEICTGRGWRNLGSGNKPRKLRRSCMELLFIDGIVENGVYWINPSHGKDTQHAVRVYCDMVTSGGGWTLMARVTDAFRWLCPEMDGSDCERSTVDPRRANLFHRVHERDLVDLVPGTGPDTGVHVDNSVARYIFNTGRKQIRFSFVSDVTSGEDGSLASGWHFSEDAYASFRQDVEQTVFKDGTWAQYSRANLSYTWNVIRHERAHLSFTGDVICWGNKVATPYRYHEGGLHMGLPSSSLPCQLAIDPQAVMLKSIYAAMGENGNSQWVDVQRSYMGDGSMSAENQRVAIWVR